MEWLLYLSLAAGSLAVIWLSALSFIAAHQHGTIRQLRSAQTNLEQSMRSIDGKLDTILRAQEVAAEVSRQVAAALDARQGRHGGRGSTVTIRGPVEAVAGNNVGAVTDSRKGESPR